MNVKTKNVYDEKSWKRYKNLKDNLDYIYYLKSIRGLIYFLGALFYIFVAITKLDQIETWSYYASLAIFIFIIIFFDKLVISIKKFYDRKGMYFKKVIKKKGFLE